VISDGLGDSWRERPSIHRSRGTLGGSCRFLNPWVLLAGDPLALPLVGHPFCMLLGKQGFDPFGQEGMRVIRCGIVPAFPG
jgi:hypothetical protein